MLKLKNICVNYSYKTVLTDISLNFEKGKIYSLLGENGAGKSTLAHVLCGDILPTSGHIELDGRVLKIKNPRQAIKNGIVCVHQRPLLSSSISIRENLVIGIEKKEFPRIPKLMKKWLPEQKLEEPVKNLSPAQTFTVSLIGALLKNPSVLILDEPPELEKEIFRELAGSGISIIMITHSFKEAVEKSDEIVLLKDGEILETTPASKLSENDIKKKLFGLTKTVIMPDFIEEKNITEEEVMKLRNKISGASPKMTEKSEPGSSRIVSLPGQARQSIGYIPSDRTFRASNPNLTVFQLCTAYHTKENQQTLIKFAETLLKKAEVNIRLYEKASCLSGGMLQRLILEREIAENPMQLYLFDPTHGLDVEATERLFARLEGLAKNGTKIIIGKKA